MTEMTYDEFREVIRDRYIKKQEDSRIRSVNGNFLNVMNNVTEILATDEGAAFFGDEDANGNSFKYTAVKLTEDILEEEFWLSHPHLDAEFYFAASCDETGAEQFPGDPGYITEGFGMSYGTKVEGEPARFYCLMSDEVFVKYLWLVRNNFVYENFYYTSRGMEAIKNKYKPSDEEIARYDTAIQKYCEKKGVVLDDTGFDYFDVEHNCTIVYARGK